MKIAMVSMPVQDPVKAHEIYTTQLGFVSKEFNPEAQVAVVVSPEEMDGVMLLLEHCVGNFAEQYQKAAYDANLPVMVFKCQSPAEQLSKLESLGVVLRPDLDRPDWGMVNLFEDGCGNLTNKMLIRAFNGQLGILSDTNGDALGNFQQTGMRVTQRQIKDIA